jgi:uncharacterized protein
MTTAPPPVREPAWSLSRSAIGLWVTEGVIASVFLGIGATAAAMFVAVLLYAVAVIAVRPRVRFRVHRWEVTADAVYTLTGWLTRTWTLVPISRIQTVDVTRGVLQQLFGLSTVAVLTASSQGTVRVWHLEADVAQRVADDLAHRAEQVRDIAT